MSHDDTAPAVPPKRPEPPTTSPEGGPPKREVLSGPTRLLLPLALAVIVIFGMKYAASVLNPIFFALFLTMGVSPALYWLRRRGVPSWLCVVISHGGDGHSCSAVRAGHAVGRVAVGRQVAGLRGQPRQDDGKRAELVLRPQHRHRRAHQQDPQPEQHPQRRQDPALQPGRHLRQLVLADTHLHVHAGGGIRHPGQDRRHPHGAGASPTRSSISSTSPGPSCSPRAG